MELSNQTQKAGDNSNLVQSNNAIINNYYGVTESRAREIFKELSADTYAKYTQEAYATIDERLEKFKNEIVKHFLQYDNVLKAFSDPEFQFLLKRAQLHAAITDRESDYTLLAKLLMQHIQNGEDRLKRSTISYAVEIVDSIDNSALLALTVFYLLSYLRPAGPFSHDGLTSLSQVMEKLPIEKLPAGSDWIDHLELLKAIRIVPLWTPRKLSQYYPECVTGYVSIGIKAGSLQHEQARRILQYAQLPDTFLCPNEFLSEYVRIPISSLSLIKDLTFNSVPLTELQQQTLQRIISLYDTDAGKQQMIIKRFMEEWDSFPVLKQIHTWWDSIPRAFDATPVGVLLANLNSRILEPKIPAYFQEYSSFPMNPQK